MLLLDQLAKMLPNSVIVTTYNKWGYFYERLRDDLRPDSPFPRDTELADTVKVVMCMLLNNKQ